MFKVLTNQVLWKIIPPNKSRERYFVGRRIFVYFLIIDGSSKNPYQNATFYECKVTKVFGFNMVAHKISSKLVNLCPSSTMTIFVPD